MPTRDQGKSLRKTATVVYSQIRAELPAGTPETALVYIAKSLGNLEEAASAEVSVPAHGAG
eukprot:6183477-Pleurochrysis_carterae.AAC.2